MFVNQLKLRNFRCFTERTFHFDKGFIVIEGRNGTGKTSILEALYYTCYLRSFRTHLTKELVCLTADPFFFIGIDFSDEKESYSITIGASEREKIVKLNGKPIKTFKEIISRYRVVSLSEDDLALIQGAPEVRRIFINQSLLISYPEYGALIKGQKQTVLHRNSLLARLAHEKSAKLYDEFYVWSKQLWEQSVVLIRQRKEHLLHLVGKINDLLLHYFKEEEHLAINMHYQAKYIEEGETFEHFWSRFQKSGYASELVLKRSIYGAHLDDIVIEFQDKKARMFASRGQQKLIAFLIKVAQVLELHGKNEKCSLLLDDFLTDFDEKRVERALNLLKELSKSCQIFITTPHAPFIQMLDKSLPDFQEIRLT